MTLRIAIDGPQSTGKTTLFEALSKRWNGLIQPIPEASRAIAPQFGVQSAADWPALLSSSRLREFFLAEERWLIAQEERAPRCLVDSSLIQIAAYRTYFGFPRANAEVDARRYDLILYCPPSFTFVPDHFRFAQGRSEVHGIYQTLLHRTPVQYFIQLPSTARTEIASYWINQCMNVDTPQ